MADKIDTSVSFSSRIVFVAAGQDLQPDLSDERGEDAAAPGTGRRRGNDRALLRVLVPRPAGAQVSRGKSPLLVYLLKALV